MPKTVIRIALMRIPARRAASALPPTANTCRPNRVRVATYSMPPTKARRINTASGRPRSLFTTAIAAIAAAAASTIRMIGPASCWSASPAVTRLRQASSVPPA